MCLPPPPRTGIFISNPYVLSVLEWLVQFRLVNQPGLRAEAPPLAPWFPGCCANAGPRALWSCAGADQLIARESGLNIKRTKTIQGLILLLFKKKTTPCPSLTHKSCVCISKLNSPGRKFLFLFFSLPRVPETKVTIIIFSNRTRTKEAQSESSENQNKGNSQNKGRSASQPRSFANCYLFSQGINVPSKHQTPGFVAIHLGHCQQCFKIRIRDLWVSSHEVLSRNKSIIDKFFFFYLNSASEDQQEIL